ncbi:hypothetical protein GAYE_SCF45G5774 [Galdieria yellowstonensis]|uniref:Uncharacterized protein n=1 Tax=Galdieria yellowstonensis TaxID=3028027 RepID=A0AAV9IKP9_9RHOD|nr:hypothetical protein GAYE_SCF45G5774 [Galdieria yellowstonensis]
MSSFAELDKESSLYKVAILQVCRDELLEETNYKRTLAVCSALIWVWKDRAGKKLATEFVGFSWLGKGCNEREAFEGASSVFVCWSSIGKTKNDLFPCSFSNKYLVERLFRFCSPCF